MLKSKKIFNKTLTWKQKKYYMNEVSTFKYNKDKDQT